MTTGSLGAEQPVGVKELLRSLDLGSSVAEHDSLLARYFVETETFRQLVEDRGDIIAGDKGTGKTALFQILKDRYTRIPELENVEVVAGFNPVGTPIFQRIAETGGLSEAQYIGLWKAYFLALAGNWLLALYEGEYSAAMLELDQLLTKVGLRAKDDSATTVFSQLVNRFKSSFALRSASQSVAFGQEGMPTVVTHSIDFDRAKELPHPTIEIVRHDEALALLDDCLAETDLTMWIVMDRLDEAFQAFPNEERPALRALFRAYLDLLEFRHIRVKLFVRRDLFARIIAGGFVNLTHVFARRIQIVWDEEDLRDLLIRRIRESDRFLNLAGLVEASPDEVFDAVFPNQVDPGNRKPKAWRWMMSRIRDGNDVKPPRNLIDLVLKSQEAQLRAEDRDARVFAAGTALLTGDSLKRGLDSLSNQRVEDTLLAEAGILAADVEKFRDGKAEHDKGSLWELLGSGSTQTVKELEQLGFLEQTGASYKVPMLYRSGLGITQGRAFQSDTLEEAADEDEEVSP